MVRSAAAPRVSNHEATGRAATLLYANFGCGVWRHQARAFGIGPEQQQAEQSGRDQDDGVDGEAGHVALEQPAARWITLPITDGARMPASV